MSIFFTQYILQTAVDPKKKNKYGFEGGNLRNRNLVVVLVLEAVVKSKVPYYYYHLRSSMKCELFTGLFTF